MINKMGGVPLYIQLADQIRNDIIEGRIKPGEKLLSESEMTKLYKIGRLTIREALSVLVNEGLLVKQHGKGTFCIAVPLSEKRLKFDVLLDMMDVYFIPYYLQSICNVFENRQCEIVINDTKNDNNTINTLLTDIISRGSDGVIIQPCSMFIQNSEETENVFAQLIRADIPYIMLDGVYENVAQSYVVLDEKKAGRIAAEHFLNNGHKNLCVINNSKYRDSRLRTEGFAEIVETPPFLVDFDGDINAQLENMLEKRSDITGIFCYNDLAAKACMEFLNLKGVKVPEDISVVSMDDTVIASTVAPMLTSIVHPKERLGEAAATALYNIKTKNAKWPYQKVFEPTLKIRNSVFER